MNEDRYKSLFNRRRASVEFANELLVSISSAIETNGRKPDSLSELVRWLNTAGVTTRRKSNKKKKERWYRETLSNYLYIGSILRNGRKDQLSVMEKFDEARSHFALFGRERVTQEEKAARQLVTDAEQAEAALLAITGPMNARELFGGRG